MSSLNGIDSIDIIRDARTGRSSSFDRTGANADAIGIAPGEARVIADIAGPGRITHIWLTQRDHYRDCLIRITWDDAAAPSVLCPLGDFFCLGHTIVNNFQSALFTASTRFACRFEEGAALNCYVPMSFAKRALVEIVNEGDTRHGQYFYVDYEKYDSPPPDPRGYFHAEFRRTNPWRGWGPDYSNGEVGGFPNKERCAWENNYVILETKGRGHYIGCNMSVTNLKGDWWGEGDDMIWIDGYKWPPDLHGTGSEDYFNQAWGMNETAYLRNGSSIWEGHTSADSRYGPPKAAAASRLVGGYQTAYVFHLDNPVRFTKEIKVTIEAGHANHKGADLASVAYWYAEEPTGVIAPPPVEKRRPTLQNNRGEWIIDESARCPGPVVAKNAEFIKAAEEYNTLAAQKGWKVFEFDTWGE